VLAQPASPSTQLFNSLAEAVHREVTALEKGVSHRPTVSFSAGTGIHVRLNNGTTGLIHPAELRRRCRCANCIEEFSGRPLLNPADVPENIYPVRLQPMGNYAVAVQWSDGHSSSIYPYDFLLELAGLKETTKAHT
jgi:DUF971 family protein